MKPFDPNVMEKLAESDDHANFIQNSIEMLPLNIYSNIITNITSSDFF